MTLLFALLAAPSPAQACPAVAFGETEAPSYDTARVVLAQAGGATTFTVSVNPEGEPGAFSLVLPVATVLAQEDIRVVDPEALGRLEGYTGVLRMPDAGCVQSYAMGSYGSDGGGCFAEAAYSAADTIPEDGYLAEVTVEAEYNIGGYEIVILSAIESEDLLLWLSQNGYALSPSVLPAIDDYLDQGMYFIAAKVDAEQALANGAPLTPLQVRYPERIDTVPIKLAAMSSPGEQDMLLYVLNSTEQGRAAISNYQEISVADKCIWGEDGKDDFDAFYDSRFRPAWEEAGQAAWAVEFAGTPFNCMPCSGVTLTPEDIAELGYPGSDVHITRLHMRYTQQSAKVDLALYNTGDQTPRTTSFADANPLNATCIEACYDSPGELWMEANSEETEAKAKSLHEAAILCFGPACGGCSSSGDTRPWGVAIGSLLGLALMRRRRA